MTIKRPTLGEYQTAYDGRMKPLKDYEVENRLRIRRDEPAGSVDERAVRRQFNKYAPEQWRHMDSAFQEGYRPLGRSGNLDTQAQQFANQFGRARIGHSTGDNETIVNTPEAIERAQRIADMIRNQKLAELVDNAVGYTEDVVDAYRDLEFEADILRNQDPDVSETDIMMDVHFDTQDYDINRIGWQEHFRTGAGRLQFQDPEDLARKAVRTGSFDADKFAEAIAQEYERVLPDIQNEYQAQDIVNSFANSYVEDYTVKAREKFREEVVSLNNMMIVAKERGDVEAAVKIRARFEKRRKNTMTRLENAQKWRSRILKTSLRDPAKAVNDVINFADRWGGMNEAQRDLSEKMRQRLDHQQRVPVQHMLRRQETMKQIMETMGRSVPGWLGEMISRTRHAAELDVERQAKRLQALKERAQGENSKRPKLHGNHSPRLAGPPKPLRVKPKKRNSRTR